MEALRERFSGIEWPRLELDQLGISQQYLSLLGFTIAGTLVTLVLTVLVQTFKRKRVSARAATAVDRSDAYLYRPKYTLQNDADALRDFVKDNSFATLVCTDGSGALFAAHVPLTLELDTSSHLEEMKEADMKQPVRGRLTGHVSRANPIWRAMQDSGNCLAIFSGPHAYVSSSWYERPGENVPTWNYTTVHIRGTTRIVEDNETAEKKRILKDLTKIHETARLSQLKAASRNPEWTLESLDPTKGEQMLRQIVFFHINITRVEGKFKLSQNRSDPDQLRVVQQYEKGAGGQPGLAVAAMMREFCPVLKRDDEDNPPPLTEPAPTKRSNKE